MCQGCRDEWGGEITERIDAFLQDWPNAEFGPAHIVLSDLNCEPHHVRWCLGLIAGELTRRGIQTTITHTDEARGLADLNAGALGGNRAFYADSDTAELQATALFLRDWLLPRVEPQPA